MKQPFVEKNAKARPKFPDRISEVDTSKYESPPVLTASERAQDKHETFPVELDTGGHDTDSHDDSVRKTSTLPDLDNADGFIHDMSQLNHDEYRHHNQAIQRMRDDLVLQGVNPEVLSASFDPVTDHIPPDAVSSILTQRQIEDAFLDQSVSQGFSHEQARAMADEMRRMEQRSDAE